MTKPATRLDDHAHILYHIGLALSYWQNIEINLGQIFAFVMVGDGDQSSAYAAFNTIESFAARLKMTHATITASPKNSKFIDDWNAIYADISKKKEKRNRLAHLSIVCDVSKPNKPVWSLAPSPLKSKAFHDAMSGKGIRYNWMHIEKFGNEFNQISGHMIKLFAKIVNEHAKQLRASA